MKKAAGKNVGVGFRAGVGSRDITTEAAGVAVRDRLYAKALVLHDGRSAVAIVAMDTTAVGARRISQGILDDVADDFVPRLRERVQRELGIPGSHVLVNASHTHPPGRLLCDDEEQIERTFDAVRQAAASLTEARIGAGAGHEDRLTVNRGLRLRNGREWSIRHSNPCPPDDEVAAVGPIDPEIGILRVDRLDGRPLAVVYNFASHLLFGDARGSITANLPGIASALIEEALGQGTMALFLQGAAGNLVDIEFKDFNHPRDLEPLGTRLALSTLRAWRRIVPAEVTLDAASETVALPRRTDFPTRLAELREEQAALLESLRSTTLDFQTFLPLYLRQRLRPNFPSDYSYRYLQDAARGDDRRAAMDEWGRAAVDKYLRNIRAMERLTVIQDDLATLLKHQAINAAAGTADIPMEVQGLRVGEAVLIASPAELLVEIGLRLKQTSPFARTLVVPFSNGYMHYGAPAEAYGRGGYEVAECLLAPEWQPLFEATAGGILRRLHSGSRPA